MHEVILIRHAQVELRWKPICYGAMDVPLSETGLTASKQLAQIWSTRAAPSLIFHSGLQRTELLAQMISRHFPSTPIIADARLRERDYGTWQGRRWDEIFADHPDLHKIVDQPNRYRPYGGETTSEMQSRVAEWFESLSKSDINDTGYILAISHSGPMAALAGHCLELHASRWQPWTVKTLESLTFQHCLESGSIQVSR